MTRTSRWNRYLALLQSTVNGAPSREVAISAPNSGELALGLSTAIAASVSAALVVTPLLQEFGLQHLGGSQ